MKIRLPAKIIGYSALGFAMMLIGANLTRAQTSDLTINNFDSGTAQDRFGIEWGSGTVLWDEITGNPAGALLMTANFSGASDTPLSHWICLNGNPWWVGTALNVSQYKSLQFDIKWDNTSDITIDQFNNLGTWPTTLTNSLGQNVFQSWAGAGYLAGSIDGLEITLCGGPGGQMAPTIAITNIPTAAGSGWARVIVPINQSQPNLDGVSGIVFHKWVRQNWGIQNTATARFWIDNVMLEGSIPPAAPTVSLSKAQPGLNLFAGSSGGNDRHNIRTVATTTGANYSWIGRGNTPVSYSFTTTNYPEGNNPYFMVQSLLLPVPYDRTEGTNGTVGTESAADWNYPTCIFMDLERFADGSMSWKFRYKTNSPPPNGNGTYYSDVLAELRDYTGALGTWTLTFVNNTNVTMNSPSGLTTNFVFSPDKVSWFADTNGVALPLYYYVGCRGNGSAAGSHAVLSRARIQGAVDTLDDDFLADTSLNTGLWEIAAAFPASIQVVPAANNPVYWANWTLPANGFVLESSSSLAGPWTEILNTPLTFSGSKKALINAGDLPSSGQGYFRVVKRSFSRLQVLMPGETNAPGTVSGKIGTPDPQAANVPFNVTVRAVSTDWHPVAGVGDTVHFTSPDGAAFLPPDGTLTGGVGTFQMMFGTAGSQTVTASDVTDPTKTSDTSSSVTVTP